MDLRCLVILIILLALSCDQKKLEVANKPVKSQMNLSYGKDPFQKFDIYIPEHVSGSARTFIFIHGGGWRGGERGSMTGFMLELMEKFPDDVFITMDYTLADFSNYVLPKQTDDIHELITFLQKNPDKYPVPSDIILAGYSAGGHLAALYGYKYQNEAVSAVVNIAGPVDLTDFNFQRYPDYAFVESRMVDRRQLPADIAAVEFASPVTWMKGNALKIISFFGEKDDVIPLSQKEKLDNLIEHGKVSGKSFSYPGNHHNWIEEPHRGFIISEITKFLCE